MLNLKTDLFCFTCIDSLAEAKVKINAKVNNIILASDGIVQGVKASKPDWIFEVRGNITIDVSGFAQIIARKIGFTKGFKKFGVGAEYDLFVPEWDQDKIAIIMDKPSVYRWIFPLNKRRVRIRTKSIRPITDVDPRSM